MLKEMVAVEFFLSLTITSVYCCLLLAEKGDSLGYLHMKYPDNNHNDDHKNQLYFYIIIYVLRWWYLL